MTELEILAELKQAYLNLEDIIDNADNMQLKSVKELQEVQNVLGQKYIEVYKNVEKENQEMLHFKEDLYVGDRIYLDYVTKSKDYDDQYITYKDIENEEKWWEDYNFLLK